MKLTRAEKAKKAGIKAEEANINILDDIENSARDIREEHVDQALDDFLISLNVEGTTKKVRRKLHKLIEQVRYGLMAMEDLADEERCRLEGRQMRREGVAATSVYRY